MASARNKTLKLARDIFNVDQELARTQYDYSVCRDEGDTIPIDVKRLARHFELAADQGISELQPNYAMTICPHSVSHSDLAQMLEYLELARTNGFAEAICVLIFYVINHLLISPIPVTTARLHKGAPGSIRVCATRCGRI